MPQCCFSGKCRQWYGARRTSVFLHFRGSSLSRFKVHRLRLSGSIERAKAAAKEASVSDRVMFEPAPAAAFLDGNYDLIAMFDCLHDMGEPVGIGKHVKESRSADGARLVVEPFTHDCLQDNLDPVARVYSGASTMICTPGIALAGGRTGTRRAGRRNQATKSRPRRRLKAFPARQANAVQHGLRGACLRKLHLWRHGPFRPTASMKLFHMATNSLWIDK